MIDTIAMDVLTTIWPPLLATLQILVAAAASAHVVLHKRDVRAAIGWIGLIWLVPFGGSILYAMFGVNRIRRRASGSAGAPGVAKDRRPDRQNLSRSVDGAALALPAGHLSPVARLMDRMTHVPIKGGNAIEPLVGGETAYRAMLRAIAEARRSLGLSTYIFDNDRIGRLFVDALAAAAGRAVAVRVLVDGVGAYYSRPTILAELRRRGVTAAEFLPSLLPLSIHYANLRNHRKLLISDGRIGFTGGMNIRHGHCEADTAEAIADVHFRLEGPVVGHLSETFADDWAFASGETLFGDAWFPLPATPGRVFARGVPAGPDEAFERIRWAILGALSQARQHIRIVTPYFLPDIVAGDGAPAGCPARRRDRHRHPRPQQSAAGTVGVDGQNLPPAGPRLPGLAHSRALRSCQADDGRRDMEPGRLGELGSAQPAAQLRIQRRVLRSALRRRPRQR